MFVLNGNADRILRTLKSCGLSEYESKVYFTLLLTERCKMGELSRKSSVPQPKIYLTVERLQERGLVDVDENKPKTAIARSLEPYLSGAIGKKQREVSDLIESGKLIMDTVYGLKPITMKYKDKYRVFEPKYMRRRRH